MLCRAVLSSFRPSFPLSCSCASAEPVADASGTPGKGQSSAFYTQAGKAAAVPETAEGGKTPSAPSTQAAPAAPTIPSGGVSVTAPSVEVGVSGHQAFAATAPAGRQGGGGGGSSSGGDVLTSMLFGSSGEEKAPASGSSGMFDAATAAESGGGGGDVGAVGGIAEGAEEGKGSGMFDMLERVAAAVGLIASDDEGEGAERK